MPQKAPRNKTLELSAKEINFLADSALKLKEKLSINQIVNSVIWQDAFKALDLLPDNCVDLMIVDPPYNLTKNFGLSTFKEMKNDVFEVLDDKAWDTIKTVMMVEYSRCSNLPTEAIIKYFEGINLRKTDKEHKSNEKAIKSIKKTFAR